MSVYLFTWDNSTPTGRIFMKFVIWDLSKICPKNSSFNKIWQEWVFYMKANIHFWSYLIQFFLEWEMFQTNIVEKIKTHILYPVMCPPHPQESCHLRDNVEKYCRAGWTTVAIWHMHIACWIPKSANTCSEYVICIACPLHQCLHKCTSVLHYMNIACVVGTYCRYIWYVFYRSSGWSATTSTRTCWVQQPMSGSKLSTTSRWPSPTTFTSQLQLFRTSTGHIPTQLPARIWYIWTLFTGNPVASCYINTFRFIWIFMDRGFSPAVLAWGIMLYIHIFYISRMFLYSLPFLFFTDIIMWESCIN